VQPVAEIVPQLTDILQFIRDWASGQSALKLPPVEQEVADGGHQVPKRWPLRKGIVRGHPGRLAPHA